MGNIFLIYDCSDYHLYFKEHTMTLDQKTEKNILGWPNTGSRLKRLWYACTHYGWRSVYYLGWIYPHTARTKTFYGSPIYVNIPENISIAFFGALPKIELPLTKFLLKQISHAHVFYDIGAHLGYFAVLAKDLGAEVYGFEPNPKTFEILKKNTDGAYPYAISDSNGKTDFYADLKRARGTSSFSFQKNFEKIEVETIMLDEFVKNHLPPTIMKMDVEGAEEKVINGGNMVLKNEHPTIIIEIWEHSPSKEIVLQKLEALGYSLYGIDMNGDLFAMQTIHRKQNFDSDNYVFK